MGIHTKDFAKIIDRNTAVGIVIMNKHCLPSLWDSGIFNVLAVKVLKESLCL